MTSFRFACALLLVAACSSSEDASPTPPADAGTSNDAGSKPSSDSSTDPLDEDGGADASVTVASVDAADVCPAAAKAVCDFFTTCVPEMLTGLWPSATDCEPRFRDNCLANYPPNAKVRKDDADAYATCLGGLTCDALYGPRWSIGCKSPRLASTKANGAACRSDFECTSGACTGSSTTCGTCITRKKAGDACTDSRECPYGGYCNQKCFEPEFLGDACPDEFHVCGNGLGCNATTKKCEKIGAVGATCDSDLDCDVGNLIQCNRGTKKCEKVTFLEPGATCPKAFDDGPPAVCTKGSSCIRPAGDQPGTCVTNAKVGEACGSSVRCEAFINCRNDVCVLPTYKACP